MSEGMEPLLPYPDKIYAADPRINFGDIGVTVGMWMNLPPSGGTAKAYVAEDAVADKPDPLLAEMREALEGVLLIINTCQKNHMAFPYGAARYLIEPVLKKNSGVRDAARLCHP